MSKILKLLAENRQNGFFKAEKANGEATLYVYDVIVATDAEALYWGGVSAETFVKTIRDISEPVIHLRINSPGGDVFAARAMEQAIREHKSQIIVHIDGYAASAASVIAMAGDEILIGKGSFLMIHKAWTIAMGNADDFLSTAALLDKLDGTIAQTYADKSGQDSATVLNWMEVETWFTADEAVANGFADKISDNVPKNKVKSAHWNMSAYDRAPVAAPEPEPQQDTTIKVNMDDLRRRVRLASKAA